MADNTRRLAGTAYLNVDGVSYMVAGDFAYSPSKVSRESLVGQDGVHGYSEKPVSGHISGTLRDSGSMKLSTLNAMTNVTVTLELANGKLVVGRNMWTTDTQEAKTGDGTLEVKWEGMAVTEE
ncbi:phage tail tube protein [uncultured Pseudacidovorax sp.]|uniref:phage tail tube protein n=1 Tax=uncultured Pseudacidovorax sp. TaxID=679313 RepID=UPI0026008106|nr:phage tail tube protein [uncultured Pseudacidovorax sp.]